MGLEIEHKTQQPEVSGVDDLVTFALVSWRAILGFSFLFGMCGFALSYTAAEQFRAEALLVLPGAGGVEARALTSRVADMGLDIGGALGVPSSQRFFERLAGCRTLADRVIEKFKLREVFRTLTSDDTRRIFGGRLTANVLDGTLRLTYTDGDPQRASDVCNAAAAELRALFLYGRTSKAHLKREFLEKRLEGLGTELSKAEESLKQERQRSGAIEPKEQARVTLELAGKILAGLHEQLAKIRVLELSSQSVSPELLAAQTLIQEYQSQLRSLERTPATSAASANNPVSTKVLVHLDQMPDIELRLTRSSRVVAVLEQLFLMVTKEFELARIEESNEVQSLDILDPAVRPEKRSSPVRRMYAIAFALLGLVLSTFYCYARGWAMDLAVRAPGRAAVLANHLGFLARFVGLERPLGRQEKQAS